MNKPRIYRRRLTAGLTEPWDAWHCALPTGLIYRYDTWREAFSCAMGFLGIK